MKDNSIGIIIYGTLISLLLIFIIYEYKICVSSGGKLVRGMIWFECIEDD